ncbi:unnamed protein product [Brachionus calyciflorus]|uniref:Uncharacterized protein n=1 Tax=Brachionus calyciflorus TaxID=104777 RepID=A0A814AIP6_9BILA|nr:unnamed protein product [Brachionus calyciflorus]
MHLIFGVLSFFLIISIDFTSCKAIGTIHNNLLGVYSSLLSNNNNNNNNNKHTNNKSSNKVEKFSLTETTSLDKSKKRLEEQTGELKGHIKKVLIESIPEYMQESGLNDNNNNITNSERKKRVHIKSRINHFKSIYYAKQCSRFLKSKDGINWNCRLEEEFTDETETHIERYCYCSFEYDCFENEQFYFDFDTEEEKINLDEKTIRTYEQRCQDGLEEITDSHWKCSIQIYDNELEVDGDNVSNFDSYCDCSSPKNNQRQPYSLTGDYTNTKS